MNGEERQQGTQFSTVRNLYNLHPKEQRILYYLFNNIRAKPSVTCVAKKTDTTYSHVSKTLNKFKAMGFLVTERKGREVHVIVNEEKVKRMYDLMMQGEMPALTKRIEALENQVVLVKGHIKILKKEIKNMKEVLGHD